MKTPALIAISLLTLSACGSDNANNTDDTNPSVLADPQDPTDSQDPADAQNPTNPQDASDTQDSQDSQDAADQQDQADSQDQSDSQEPANQQDTTNPQDTVDQQDSTDTQDPADPQVPDTAAGCQVPEPGTTLVSKTTPVHPNDNPYYYPIMGPQCVLPASQFDGPGLAFGDFLLTNNAWNGQQSTWDWEQCISLTAAADGSILPSWSYDWGNEDDLQPGLFEWEVKSYPEVIYGYKSNEEISAPCATTGLPVKVSDLPDMTIAYSYTATETDNRIGDKGDEANNPAPVTGGDRNIAIETFFHTSCDIQRGANTNMELELMVWLEMGNERLPSGQPPVATYTSPGGHTYDVYTKSDNYVAYVAQNPVTADTLNWSEFINDARGKASDYGVKYLQDDWCMANVIFGSEIWWGEGSVGLDYYEITSRY